MLPGKHVAVLAFPFVSHARPLADLVHNLATAATDVRFSFLNTSKSNGVIFPSWSRAELPSNLMVYDVGDGLPAGYCEDTGHPREQSKLFYDAAPKNFQAAIGIAERDAGKKVSCLLTDAVLMFACEMAEDMHLPWVAFWVLAPSALSMVVYIKQILRLESDIPGEDTKLDMIPGLSMMQSSDLTDIIQDKRTVFRVIGQVLPRAAAVIMNSFAEANVEPLTADLNSKFKLLLYLGCSMASFTVVPASRRSALEEDQCITWLDTLDPQTVVYICFGSVVTPPSHEITSLAEALEVARVPFLWSLKDNLKAHLPEGFVERTKAHGKIVPWAPQSRVLAHPSCGVHVTHCGYNSVLESVAGGVPMICRPVWSDNMMNGRMVEEVWRVGVGVEGGVITKSGMVKALKVVLRSEEGKEMRKKAGELREKLVEAAGPGGSVEADFKVLVELISTSSSA